MRPLWTRREVLRSSGVIGAGLPLSGGGPSVPSEATMFGWIRTIYERGIRRPGYPADIWVERWIAGRFRRFGLERVRLEPVTAQRWRPHRWSLRAILRAVRRGGPPDPRRVDQRQRRAVAPRPGRCGCG